MLKFYFSPIGRISRKSFWLGFILPYFVAGFVLMILFFGNAASNIEDTTQDNLSILEGRGVFIIPLVILIYGIVTIGLIKRLHDRNISGFWLIPFLMSAIVPNTLLMGGFYIGGALEIIAFSSVAVGFLLSCWLFVNAYLLRGSSGENRYGPDHLGFEI